MTRFWLWLKLKLGLRKVYVAPEPTKGVRLGGAAETKFVPYGKNDRHD